MDSHVQSVIICFVPVLQAHTFAHTRNFIFQTLDSFGKKCANKDVFENHWTIVSHDNTHRKEHSKDIGAVWSEEWRRVILWKQAKEEGGEQLLAGT